MRTTVLPNRDILPYMSARGPDRLFPAYICNERPEGLSIVAMRNSRLCGAAVGGGEAGLFAASSTWLFADDAEAASAMAREVMQKLRHGLQFPWDYNRSSPRRCPMLASPATPISHAIGRPPVAAKKACSSPFERM
jgi:hypothetical protein